MKKIFLALTVLFIGLYVFAEEELYSKPFINRFFHCLPTKHVYQNNDNISRIGISGWKNGDCRYSFDTKDENGKPQTYKCNFTRAQVNQFSDVMKQDPNGTGATKDLLDTFKKDENTCKVSN